MSVKVKTYLPMYFNEQAGHVIKYMLPGNKSVKLGDDYERVPGH